MRCVAYKSFTALINTSYSMKDSGETTEDSLDAGALSNPLSFIRSGYYALDEGGLYTRNRNGNFWGLHSINLTNTARLNIGNTNLYPIISANRGMGFAVPPTPSPNLSFPAPLQLSLLHHTQSSPLSRPQPQALPP